MSDASAAVTPIVPALAKIYSPFKGFAYPLVRIWAGLTLIPHGAQKLFGWFDGQGIDGTARFLGNVVTFMPGHLSAYLVGGTEFFGGILIALGFLTRPAALMAAVSLWVAALFVHLQFGFFAGNRGYEYVMLWGVVMIAIAIQGGRELSIDRAIGREF